jgi:aminocarboxymuconate-semialdehyde decarboxylase
MKNRPRTIDFHCHTVCHAADELVRATRAEAESALGKHASAETQAIIRQNREVLDDRLTGAEARLADMEKAGVDIQVVSPTPRQFFYSAESELGLRLSQMINEDVASLVSCAPDRFVGLGTVPLQEPRLAVQELRRAVRELGLKGVEIGTHVGDRELDDPFLEPFYREAEELGAVLFMHPSGFSDGRRLSRFYLNNIIGNPLESTIALSHLILGGVLERHDSLKLCVAHGGGFLASYAGRTNHAWHARKDTSAGSPRPPGEYLKRVYFDTLLFDPRQLSHLVEMYGEDRLLMGSDYPYDMGETDPVAFVRAATGLSEQALQKILGGNAAQLLGLTPD